MFAAVVTSAAATLRFELSGGMMPRAVTKSDDVRLMRQRQIVTSAQIHGDIVGFKKLSHRPQRLLCACRR
jgi:hypothetical protein